jgi:hypothetical protein
MTAYIYTKIIKDAQAAGVDPTKQSAASMTWLRKNYTQLKPMMAPKFLTDEFKKTRVLRPGRMYMFLYDPKHKSTLPYYDKFPLIFPFRKVPGGFYGINMHYLPPVLRARLMDALYGLQVNKKSNDETTRLRLSYAILAKAAKYRWFKPCVKRYLNKHMRSPLVYVPPTEWNMTLFLPNEQFRKATKGVVWRKSRSIIGK